MGTHLSWDEINEDACAAAVLVLSSLWALNWLILIP